MHHALAVGVIEGIRDPSGNEKRLAHLQALPLPQQHLECASGHELQGHERRTGGAIAAHVVHDHYALMREAGGASRLGEKTLLESGPVGIVRSARVLDHFEGDVPSEVRVVGPIDHAHHPAAQLDPDLVPADCLRRLAHGFDRGRPFTPRL
jgi:hypothetical protein